MNKIIVFGGTTEGRKICEFCAENNIKIIYCVATKDGARDVNNLKNIKVTVGRLDEIQILELLNQNKFDLVIDATHPYAKQASKNIREACDNSSTKLVRIVREDNLNHDCSQEACRFFSDINSLIIWLENQDGNIFVTTGSSAAQAFTKLKDYQNRVWLRVLPNLTSLQICLDYGYHPKKLICMQGPFSKELNFAMFKNANAKIIVTKDSGITGGFPEKLAAAKSLGIITAVIAKPQEFEGVTLQEALKIIIKNKGMVASARQADAQCALLRGTVASARLAGRHKVCPYGGRLLTQDY